MEKILPIYYSEYGRYLTRFRAIPFYVDCLTPVQRRLLLVLHEIAKTSFKKSAKVIGQLIGSYHPHGDQSAYKTLINMVHQGFVDKQGSWGNEALVDTKAAAYRYTECKLSKWVKDLAFDYIDFVPWDEYEYEKEPLYLPSPIPLGLIGDEIYTGIAFHRTLIPKYTIHDLTKRLIALLNKESELPTIIPSARNCTVIDEGDEGIDNFELILQKGEGKITVVPNGKIEKNKIIINGRAPNATFTRLMDACTVSEKGKQKELPLHLVDFSKKYMNIEAIPDKRKADVQQLAQTLWTNYLIKRYNINIVLCDHNGNAHEYGIDDILLRNYNAWKHAVYYYNIHEARKLFSKKKDLYIISIIRKIIQQYDVKDLPSILKYFNRDFTKSANIQLEEYDVNTHTWRLYTETIKDQDIEQVYGRKTIKSLVEIDIDLNKIDNDIQDQKTQIANIDINCFNYLKALL